MRTGTTWLVAIACGLTAQAAIAADFKEIQLWLSSGSGSQGFAALPDGTLENVKLGELQKLEHERCARATRDEMELLNRLVGQIPANAPWEREWIAPDDCSDELEASLYVTAVRGKLSVHYSLQCMPANVPRWVTEFVNAMRELQAKYAACSSLLNH